MRMDFFQPIFTLILLTLVGWSILFFLNDYVVLIMILLPCFLIVGWYIGWNFTRKHHDTVTKTPLKNFELTKETEILYESLFTNNSDGILVLDINGKVLDGNPAISDLSGYSIEEMKKLELSSFVVQEDLEKKFAHTFKVIEGNPQEYTISIINRSGNERYVMIKMVPIILKNEVVGIFEIIKDITETKKIEEMMYRSDKLNAIGQLAAGVAHEIRNPLTSLKGFLQLSKPKLSSEYVKIMEEELERINQIVGEFLFLSKPQKITFVSNDLTKIITDVITFVRPEALLTNVQIHTDFDEDIPLLNCDRNQLKQVFINLLKNAMEAMPLGGNIFVMVKKEEEWISIRIKDEGIGIPKEVLDKIGQPFYTTKQDGNGLGILVTYRIVEAHGGSFSIKSEVNKGTVAEILFPVSNESLQTSFLKDL